MKNRDKSRFEASMSWFNQFFDGLRQIYEHIPELMPADFFPEGFALNIENYYFPRHKAAPFIPPYYALIMGGREAAVQAIAVIDAGLFAPRSPFTVEPSIIVVVHTQAEKYAWVDEFAMKVIKLQNIEVIDHYEGIVWGKIMGMYPADFFAFQVKYDRFSESMDARTAIQRYLVKPIMDNLERGFPQETTL
jgi:hypothetical protein